MNPLISSGAWRSCCGAVGCPVSCMIRGNHAAPARFQVHHAALLHDAPGPHPDDQACQAKAQKSIWGGRLVPLHLVICLKSCRTFRGLLEVEFPEPRLVPPGDEEYVKQLLQKSGASRGQPIACILQIILRFYKNS